MIRGLIRCLLCLSCLYAVGSPARGDVTISYMPTVSVVGVGDVFSVDVVADIPAVDAIVGWGLDVGYDHLVIAHDPLFDVTMGPLWDSSFNPDGDGLAGTIHVEPLLPPPFPISGPSVLLATLTFEAIGPGMSLLAGSFTELDPFEGLATFAPIPPKALFLDGSVTVETGVAAVPVPGAALLGLLGLGLVRGFRGRPRKD